MIPKIIHLCWMSGDPFPEKIQKCIDSWKEKLPDYEIKLWDKSSFDVSICKWTQQAFNCKQYAFVADYVRFYALLKFGGIYLDSDVEVLKSFNDLLDKKFFFGYEYTALPEAAVVGSEAGEEWLKECLHFYETHDFIDENGDMKRIIAPIIMKMGFEKINKVKLIDLGKIIEFNGGIICPFFFFSAKNGFNGKLLNNDSTYSIHHFNSAWLKKGKTIIIKKYLHLILIKIFGKLNYNKLLFFIRNNKRNIL